MLLATRRQQCLDCCEPFLAGKPHASLPIADRPSIHAQLLRHAFNCSPSVRGGSEGIHFEVPRVFLYIGKKTNWREGFRDAVADFVLAEG